MSNARASHRPHPCWVNIEATADYIQCVQRSDGEIPWSAGGKTDPWDHVECAMGLTVAGRPEAARRAYRWSAGRQLPDGSWWSTYRDGRPDQAAYTDTNMTAYIAAGLYHYATATGDGAFLEEMWPVIRRAIDWAVAMQQPSGAICWARRADGSVSTRALLTGSSSIFMSLTCALKIAALLGKGAAHWNAARSRLGNAIRQKPHRFDQTKNRFSMDWYYPVLCGAVTGDAAWKRIRQRWTEFAVPGWGVRCVSDRRWTTMAETAELTLALTAIGRFGAAETVFNWIGDKKYSDGAFWTGVTFPEGVIYTAEKTTWTGAAVLLAADSLYGLTPASRFFRHDDWKPVPL